MKREATHTEVATGKGVTVEKCGGACGCYGQLHTVRLPDENGTPIAHPNAGELKRYYREGAPDWVDELLNGAAELPTYETMPDSQKLHLGRHVRAFLRRGIERVLGRTG